MAKKAKQTSGDVNTNVKKVNVKNRKTKETEAPINEQFEAFFTGKNRKVITEVRNMVDENGVRIVKGVEVALNTRIDAPKKLFKSKKEEEEQKRIEAGRKKIVVHKSLSQLMGDKGEGKYPVNTIEEYEELLNKMNRAELYSHATKYEIIPRSSMPKLKADLIKKFIKHRAKYAKIDEGDLPVPNLEGRQAIGEIMRRVK